MKLRILKKLVLLGCLFVRTYLVNRYYLLKIGKQPHNEDHYKAMFLAKLTCGLYGKQNRS